MRSKHKKTNIKKVIIITLTIVILVSVVCLIVNLIKNKNKNDEMNELLSSIKVTPTEEKTEMMLKLEELQKTNSEIVAWIKIDGTNINYPVLQATDNNFYMSHYYKSEKNVFRYYYFINAQTEQEYNEYVENSKKASLYDTGKTAQYGDQLLTLSTCSYHTEDGRLAVVARKVK